MTPSRTAVTHRPWGRSGLVAATVAGLVAVLGCGVLVGDGPSAAASTGHGTVVTGEWSSRLNPDAVHPAGRVQAGSSARPIERRAPGLARGQSHRWPWSHRATATSSHVAATALRHSSASTTRGPPSSVR